MIFTFEQTKEILNVAKRWELRDHAFGDTEFGWDIPNSSFTAGGYSSGSLCDVWISMGDETTNFDGEEARELKHCGTLDKVERNDMTGPTIYVEGQVMPGLTKEGVRAELTEPPAW